MLGDQESDTTRPEWRPARLRVLTPPYRRGEEEEARQACGVSVTGGAVGGVGGSRLPMGWWGGGR